MSTLHLRLRRTSGQPIDVSTLTPERLAGLSLDAVAALEIRCGAHVRLLGKTFELEHESSDNTEPRVELHEPGGLLDGVGTSMNGGTITVHGDAGAFLGHGMTGGRIDVHGACGAYAGTGMEGGEVRIDGDAGAFLGAALPGERTGMRGGELVVRGSTGNRTGERMRGGVVLVQGRVGASCAARMIAGTIVARGGAGPGVGRGMRRGTVLLGRTPEELPCTFFDGGPQRLGFVTLLEHHLRGLGGDAADSDQSSVQTVQRWVGDLANGGLGEILVPV